MKRFTVRNYLRQDLFTADTTLEVYEFLKTQDLGLNSFYIECLTDVIEVHSDDFFEAFERGERPEDLQFF